MAVGDVLEIVGGASPDFLACSKFEMGKLLTAKFILSVKSYGLLIENWIDIPIGTDAGKGIFRLFQLI